MLYEVITTRADAGCVYGAVQRGGAGAEAHRVAGAHPFREGGLELPDLSYNFV